MGQQPKKVKSSSLHPRARHQPLARSPIELASNALSNQRHIRPAPVAVLRRHLRQDVAGIKVTRSPADPAKKNKVSVSRAQGLYQHYLPAKVDIRVRIQESELLAHVRQARAVIRPAAGLGEHGLALVLAEPVAQSLEGGDIVGHAVGVRAGVVRVEVLETASVACTC